jgi:hypothetical protein
MSRNRFETITSNIRFSHQPDEQADETSVQYRWMLVNDFIDAINRHRKNHVVPSEIICVDESISRWYGIGGSWIDVGIPHYVAIDRKPENGCEIQNMACGRGGFMLKLRLVTTAVEEAIIRSQSGAKDVLHGSAVLFDLVEHFAGSNRIICADSYFASVQSAEGLAEMGLKFIGVVKNSTRKYPMKQLSTTVLANRGDRLSMVCKDANSNVTMMAAVWMDRERRYFISTTSTTLDGSVYNRSRWRQTEEGPQRVELEVPQPKFAEIYYSAASAIDRHNRCRQDDLMLERKIRTHDWSFRVNLSLLGICAVDAWLLYSNGRGDYPHINQREFYERLAQELIDNSFDSLRTRERPSDSENVSPNLPTEREAHLTPTKKKRKVDGRETCFLQQGRCKMCGSKTTQICSGCITNHDVVWLCASKKNCLCFAGHFSREHAT